jgi:hypothetical protein
MYGELYQYLVLHKQLNVPGVGTFQLERKPADLDFVNKTVNPPSHTISLHHGLATPQKRLFTWLASALGISERDAVIRFNDFVFDLKDQVQSGQKLEWKGIGTLSKGLAGEIRFDPMLKDQPEGMPVPAVKVLREHAEHKVRVGEDEKTSSEMIELLHVTEKKRSYRRMVAWIVAILAILFIVFYFSINGWNTATTANHQKVAPKETSDSHKVLQ